MRGRPRLPRPRHVLDAGRHARARLLLRLRRAAGHADGPRPGADGRARSSTPGSAAASPARCASTARSATPTASPARSCAAASALRSTTTFELVDAIKAAIPAPARFAGGHPAKRTFQAIRIAVNDELDQLDAALPLAWEILRDGRPARRRSPSTRSRTGASSASSPTAPAAASARPDLPVCGCGRTPEAELIFRRSIVPSAGRGRRQPALEVRPAAGRPQAQGGALHEPPAPPRGAPARTARPRSRATPAGSPAPPTRSPGRSQRSGRPAGPPRLDRRLRAPARAARAPHRRPAPARARVDLARSAIVLMAASSPCRSRC